MKTILTSITLFLIAGIAIAYSPATPELYVITSGGKFFFVMDPGNFSDIPSKGIAYRAKRNGVKKLWEVTGWDQSSGGLFLSEDGEFLVRIRGAIDHPNKEVFGQNEILLFYRRGKLIKSYALKELVLDLEKGIIISSMPPNTGWINYDGDNSPRISPSAPFH